MKKGDIIVPNWNKMNTRNSELNMPTFYEHLDWDRYERYIVVEEYAPGYNIADYKRCIVNALDKNNEEINIRWCPIPEDFDLYISIKDILSDMSKLEKILCKKEIE